MINLIFKAMEAEKIFFLQNSLQQMLFPRMSENVITKVACIMALIFIVGFVLTLLVGGADGNQESIIALAIITGTDLVLLILFFLNIFLIVGIVVFSVVLGTIENNWSTIKSTVKSKVKEWRGRKVAV